MTYPKTSLTEKYEQLTVHQRKIEAEVGEMAMLDRRATTKFLRELTAQHAQSPKKTTADATSDDE